MAIGNFTTKEKDLKKTMVNRHSAPTENANAAPKTVAKTTTVSKPKSTYLSRSIGNARANIGNAVASVKKFVGGNTSAAELAKKKKKSQNSTLAKFPK